MGNVQFWHNKVLFTPAGKVAMDPACCCDGYYKLTPCYNEDSLERCPGGSSIYSQSSVLEEYVDQAILYDEQCWSVEKVDSLPSGVTPVTIASVTDSYASCNECCGPESGHCCHTETLKLTLSNKVILSLDEPGVVGDELDYLLGTWMLDSHGHQDTWCVWRYQGDDLDCPAFELIHYYLAGSPPSGIESKFWCEAWSYDDSDTMWLWYTDWVTFGHTGPNCWPMERQIVMMLGDAQIQFDMKIEIADE